MDGVYVSFPFTCQEYIMHSLCEIEYFVKSRIIILVVCPQKGYRSATPVGTVSVACTTVNREMLINLCAEAKTPL